MVCLLAFLVNAGQSFGQKISANPWQIISEQTISVNPEHRQIIPKKYLTAKISPAEMRDFLQNAPLWFTPAAENAEVILSLPMPDGNFEEFRIENAPVMHPDLAKKFPEIQSFAGVGITDPAAYLRFDMTQVGFHAMILSPNHNAVFIDPYSTEDAENYIVHFKKDSPKTETWVCETDSENAEKGLERAEGGVQNRLAGDCILRTFSLALAATGEYSTFHGGTVALALAAMTTSMTRVNGVFEKDASIHMNMVANNNLLVYLNGATDPYTNGNGSTMLGENQTNCDAVIGSANYDIGHVFSTGGGGVAYLGAVCNNSIKAGGVTGSGAPIGDAFDIDYVAHEMGHQYGGNHTQNNNCNRVSSASHEPGSASTIMGYAGICSPNVQNNSDAYFHAHSLAEFATEIASSGGGNSCSTNSDINDAPTAAAGADFTIPKSTPFVLTGTSSDPNGDAMTHCWEQMNPQWVTMPPVATNASGPAFRSLTPMVSPLRYFPNLPAIIANTTPTWEVLAGVARTYNFRFTVRDNKIGGGCTAEDNTVITVNGTAGPFLVTAPNVAGINWPALSSQTITWDVASTNIAPVNAVNVDIFLSLDGGNTYPITLATATPNDGSHAVTIPDNQTTTARIMVRGSGNIFFDISNVNFTISAPQNDFTFDVTPNSVAVCQPADAIFTVNIGTAGSFSGDVTLATTNLPANATATFSQNPVTAPGTSVLTISNLGNVAPGNYGITVSGTGSTGTKSETVGLFISSVAPAAPVLTTPADAATGVSSLPTFNWTAPAGAFTFDLQVSTSSNFANFTINQTGLSANTYTATTALASGTTYFWRSRAVNTCGMGDWSAVFSFTTANITCTTFASTDVPKTISATGTPTVTSVLPIAVSGTITDVNLVNLNITHTWINDLVVKIKSPATTERTMINRICNDQNNIITNFDDEAVLLYTDLPCPPIQNLFYKPFQTLAQFDNQNINGTWTLTINDLANNDGGTLNSWGLNVCYLPSATPPTVVVTGTNVSCFGGSNGSATATASGGNGSFTYAWSNGGTTATISNLTTGTYTVSVTSAGQTATGSYTVTQPTAVAVSVSGTNVSCFGGSNGTATAAASGGTAPFTFLWSNGATTATISGLAAGTYFATATDANACTSTGSVVISAPAQLVATVSGTNVLCNSGTSGTASVAASGGTAPFTFSWSNGATTATISGLVAGTYSATATDANGCTATGSVTISQPTALAVSVSGTPATNGNDGTTTATPTGGTPAYSYLWSNGGTTQTISGLVAGTYSNTTTDANGCTATGSVTIAGGGNPIDISISTTNVSCFGGSDGSATATATGGNGSFTFAWSNGATTATISGLNAGSYIVSVTSGAATATTTAVISQPASALTATATGTNILCNGASTGTATATATGGTAPYTFLWSNGGTTQTISGLPAGTYTVSATDANGCTATASVTLTQPAGGINLAFVATKPSCFGGANGKLKVTATAGTAPYTYLWSNGQTVQTAINLAAGTYSVVVTGANGCTRFGSGTVTQPTEIVISSFTAVAPACPGDANGTLKVTATGGTTPYTYLWSNGQTTQTATGLAAGTYSVTVKDKNLCTKTGSGTVANPPAIVITSITSQLLAAGYKVTVNAVGGTGTKKYRRSTGPGTWTTFQTSKFFTGLTAGTYTFEVQDTKLCTVSQTTPVPVPPTKPGVGNLSNFEILANPIDFQLAPNPARDMVKIVFSENIPFDFAHGTLQISDVSGRVVRRFSLENLVENGGQIDLSGIPSGIFLVTLRADGEKPVTRKLVVE